MEHRFDLFTKAMMQEMPRRGALKRIGGGLAALFVAGSGATETVLAKPGGNAACAQWCHANFQGSAAGHCTADAAHGEGVCYQCGPAAPTGSTAILCNDMCVPSDVKNCGTCSNVCTTPANGTAICTNGTCDVICNAGFTRCGGQCVNVQTDPTNCGLCSHTCGAGQICTSGVCQSPRPQVCMTGTDPQFGSKYIVCRADATSAWISSDQPGGGKYHTDEICQRLGYHAMGQFGGTCGNICGHCQGDTSCMNPGNEIYDGVGTCGADANGRIECYTVTWQCV